MKMVSLNDISESIEYGVTASASETKTGPKFLRITDIQNGSVNWDTVPYCNAEPSKLSSARLRSGDIVFARTGATTGKSFLIRHCPDQAVFASYLIRVRPSKDVDPSYLGHFFDSKEYWRQITLKASGAAQPGVNASKLKEIAIPLPPLDEQRRIAGILDQADALRRLRARALDKLNTLGQAIFHEMFGEPSANPFKFPPKKLSEIVRVIGGSQPEKKFFLYDDGPDRVRFVQTRDFRTDEYKTYVPRELAKRPFNEDDVIIGRYGPPVFQIFRGLSGTYNVALMKAEPVGDITKDFVFYLLQEPKLHSYVVANSERTAGQSGVNLALLNEYPVFAPPAFLLEDFSNRLKEAERLQGACRFGLEGAETLFTSLQHRAFRGEL